MPFRVIIAGSRDFDDFDLLTKACDKLLLKYESKFGQIEIVSGCAKGADQLGERYAELRNYRIKHFQPDWGRLGPKAGYVRNEEMANYANACIVFWNGLSKGAKHMKDIAKKKNLALAVINVQPKS